MIIRRDAVDAAGAETAEEIDGRWRTGKPNDVGDLTGPVTLLPEPEHRLTDRDRNGTWHGRISQKALP